MGVNIGVIHNCLFDYQLLAQNWVKFNFSFNSHARSVRNFFFFLIKHFIIKVN